MYINMHHSVCSSSDDQCWCVWSTLFEHADQSCPQCIVGLGSDGRSIATLRTEPSFILNPHAPQATLPPQGCPLQGIRLQEVSPFPCHTQLHLSEWNQAKLQTALFFLLSHNTSDRDPQTSHQPHVLILQQCKNVNLLMSQAKKRKKKERTKVAELVVWAVLSKSTFSSVDHLHLKAFVMSPCSEQQQFNMRETRAESAIFQWIRYQQQQLAYCNISLRLNK